MSTPIRALGMLLALLPAMLPAIAEDSPEPAKLYATRLQSVNVPKEIQEKPAKLIGAALPSTYVYVAISCNGIPVWNSPMREVRSNETILDWSDTPESTAAIWWDNTTHLVVKVFLNDKTESIGKPAAVDGAAGAGGGAAIGGILAGVFTGGLGIPAGAGIGALIGGLAGGTAGGATGALSANDRVLFEVDCSGAPGFPLDGSVEYAVESLGEKHTASVRFNLLEVKAPVQNGGLELGEKYIVRMHSVHLSERAALKGENNPDDARYYVVLEQGANEYSFHEDEPLILPPGINTNPGIVTVLKNTGEETRLRIYEQDFLRDDLVFSAKIAKIDGKSWVFIGKAVADDTSDSSYALFETFGPLK